MFFFFFCLIKNQTRNMPTFIPSVPTDANIIKTLLKVGLFYDFLHLNNMVFLTNLGVRSCSKINYIPSIGVSIIMYNLQNTVFTNILQMTWYFRTFVLTDAWTRAVSGWFYLLHNNETGKGNSFIALDLLFINICRPIGIKWLNLKNKNFLFLSTYI